ncbi:hypothetical protein A1O3_03371 [Capronia epimyces CBS 606.96]|uniref:BTB domain-containing protein n=1 Tax=Capronia epimyces CBS 606.96 TaxID=1182542 RepID=W9Y9W7_9EURO|nr:uncharacterized protein A1O3_03371 [Capronia epimyces CBS 606.96]EXJ86420.1 hypothetical protein A1O3_03371 [Capronia epimyces CBS 606.96]
MITGMTTLPGRRYGEPDWGNPSIPGASDWKDRFSHPEEHPALAWSTTCYEEQRLAKYILASPAMFQLQKKIPEPTLVDLANKTDVIKVIVGRDEKATWVLHEALFTAASAFAKAALSHPFAEHEQRTITLPEEDPAVFAIFVKYLYVQVVRPPSMDTTLALYVLADRLQATALCKIIFEELSFRHDELTAEQLQYVLDNTAAPDPLRYACMQRVVREIQCRSSLLNGPIAVDLCHHHAPEILAIMMGKFQEVILAPVEEVKEAEVKSDNANRVCDPFDHSALLSDLPKLEAPTQNTSNPVTYPQPLPAWDNRSETSLVQIDSKLPADSPASSAPV